MRQFVEYWIAVLRLTKDQAFAMFYRFVRFSAETRPLDSVEFEKLARKTAEDSKEILRELE